MPRNVYFSQGNRAESTLFEDLQIEALKIYGQETFYMPRTVVTRDMILNEDRESQFDDAYMVEMYIEDIEGFGGEGNLMSKFGIEIRDEVTFIVARRTWSTLVGRFNNNIEVDRPQEGDLIYLPLSNSLFEISFVEHEKPFYQLKDLPTYKLQCRLFEYSGEDFQTGNTAIDARISGLANTITVRVNDISGTIENGQRIYQKIATPAYLQSVSRMNALPGLISDKQKEISKTTGLIIVAANTLQSAQVAYNTAADYKINLDIQYEIQAARFTELTESLADVGPNDPEYAEIQAELSTLNIAIYEYDTTAGPLAESQVEQALADRTAAEQELLRLQILESQLPGQLAGLQAEYTNIPGAIASLEAALPYVAGIISSQEYVGAFGSTTRDIQISDIESSDENVRTFYTSGDQSYTYLANTVMEGEVQTFLAKITDIFDFDDEEDKTFENDRAAQNYDFENEAADIIDFSENNPFGES